METIIALIFVPIMLLNSVGGVVGGIWLIINGNWSFALSAFLVSVVGGWVIGLVLWPTLLLAMPIQRLAEKNKYVLVYMIAFLSSLWLHVVITVWCVSAFWWALGQYAGGSVIPYLLVAYAVATGPWVYMAAQEAKAGGGDSSAATSIFVCIGTLLMIGVVLMDVQGIATLWAFVATMLVSATIQMVTVVSAVRTASTLAHHE